MVVMLVVLTWLCSNEWIINSVRMYTPVLPAPLQQWTTVGGVSSFWPIRAVVGDVSDEDRSLVNVEPFFHVPEEEEEETDWLDISNRLDLLWVRILFSEFRCCSFSKCRFTLLTSSRKPETSAHCIQSSNITLEGPGGQYVGGIGGWGSKAWFDWGSSRIKEIRRFGPIPWRFSKTFFPDSCTHRMPCRQRTDTVSEFTDSAVESTITLIFKIFWARWTPNDPPLTGGSLIPE